jgi:multisubunit Na+/H+ antiporter MnhF subunit
MTSGMNVWLWAAFALLFSLVPCMIVCFRGDLADRLVALELASVLTTLDLLLICQGFAHPSFYDLPLALVLLSFGGGMVFVRFLQRWL